MKKLLASAVCSLIVLVLGADPAFAWGGYGGCCTVKCCAAQYNAFSPMCCNAVQYKKPFWCKKSCQVAESCEPACPPCPPDHCTVDGGASHVSQAPAPSAPAKAPAAANPGFQAPAPAPAGPNTSMYGQPYAVPYGMQRNPYHTTAYQPYAAQPYAQPHANPYAYPQAPMMAPGMAPQMMNGMMPMNNVPYYWNSGR